MTSNRNDSTEPTQPQHNQDAAAAQTPNAAGDVAGGIAPNTADVPGAAATGKLWADALQKAQAEAAEFKDLYLRGRADIENIRKRAQEDVSKAHKFGIEGFAESLIPVKDSLEAALGVQSATLDSYRGGIEITLRQLGQAFERNHLLEIAPQAGEKFDPNRHQAISMAPSEVPAQHIVTTLQKGYLIADRVLRPALVTVSQGAAQSGNATSKGTGDGAAKGTGNGAAAAPPAATG
jgi:molecular chaperone GrpE